MRYFAFVFLLSTPLIFSVPRVGLAQEEPPADQQTDASDQSDESQQERSEEIDVGTTVGEADRVEDIQFEVSETPVEMKFFRADPKLLEQKFVATIELSLVDADFLNAMNRYASEEVATYLRFGIFDQWRRNTSRDSPESKEFFSLLVDRLPEHIDVPTEAIEALSMDGYVQVDERLLMEQLMKANRERSDAPRSASIYLRILAPSPEAAEERARALVTLLRYGIATPLEKSVSAEAARLENEIASFQQKADQAEQASAALAEQMKGFDVSADELMRLRTERRLLSVEEAGLRARIEAVVKLIDRARDSNRGRGGTGGERDIERLSRLEDIKVAAEIDIAGVAARGKMLDELIDSGRKRRELDRERSKQSSEASVALSELQDAKSKLEQVQSHLAAVQSLYTVRQATIAPLVWTGN